jgi:hypothetical protein
MTAADVDWLDLSRRAALESHRLIGWIYWDPGAITGYAASGVPDGAGYYIASRGAPLADAGNESVTAAFVSIHPAFVGFGLDRCREASSFEAAVAARDAAVVVGLRETVPEICDELTSMAGDLWAAADALPADGRVLFAATRAWARPADDPLLSAWLAVNAIREWRGDTHWAIQIAEGLSGTEAGLLDGAWRAYEDEWLPRSRGADDAMITEALQSLEARGLAADGVVGERGIAYRQELEDRLDRLSERAWRHLGEASTMRFLDLLEPVSHRFLDRIDATAGPKWMPAGRDRTVRS